MEPDSPLRIVVGRLMLGLSGTDDMTPKGTQYLTVWVNDELYFEGYAYTTPDDPAAPYIVGRNPVLEVGSPHAVSLAQACINECVHGHQRCAALSAGTEEPLLPTRLVDCTDPDHPRLVSSDGRRGQYLALSYVWGEAQPHRTVKANLSTYTDGIAFLPKTIRDAISVTNALGFRFLWTDSLCIIQDSDEDKRRELTRMHLIYRYAYVTIIAASAQRVSEGFLQNRPAAPWATRSTTFPCNFTLPFICPLPPSSLAEGTTHLLPAVQQVGTLHITPTSTLTEPYIEQYRPDWEPISSRGWCFQEYLMSPRSLIFTSQTIQFKCLTTMENIGKAVFHYVYEDGSDRLSDVLFLPGPKPMEHGCQEWLDVHVAWLDVVTSYSQRVITVPSDKLVACAAIATEFQRVLRTDYLAGLWRATLLDDLLWSLRGDPQTSRCAEYRAPSWSWASVDEGVCMRGDLWSCASRDGSAVAEVVRCDVTLEDAALPTGQVTDGTLVLRAVLIPCALRPQGSSHCHLLLQAAQQAQRWGADGSNGEVELNMTRLEWARVDNEDDVEIRRLWAVPLAGNKLTELMRGLLVGLVGSNVVESERETRTDIFRRVGWFNVQATKSPILQDVWDGNLPLEEITIV
ncbi:hypothetical protein TRAPUB_14099 [Trametes pubescens]|uniref:Heterokaryon incompatibility domain-containing protein n=1 Tax=Trametes pubescens TaxID=154538 RepID=A0A1M2VPF4_TRAPU|nr:hypothetical protein TRAPUB_14099 [Trametes pubescens]